VCEVLNSCSFCLNLALELLVDPGEFLIIRFKQLSIPHNILIEPQYLLPLLLSKHTFAHKLFLSGLVQGKAELIIFPPKHPNFLLILINVAKPMLDMAFNLDHVMMVSR
jgi:hypothetical protein